MDAIKNFFTNKWTRLVSVILFVLSVVSLAIGGVTQEQISGALVLIFAVLAAITALVIYLNHFFKN